MTSPQIIDSSAGPSNPYSSVAWIVALTVVWAAGLSAAAALTLGWLIALTSGNPWPSHSKRLADGLLKGGVVCLGFGMHLPDVLRVGLDGFLMAACTIVATLAGGYLLGRWLLVDGRVSALISVGTAICGGSAIAALATVIVAVEGEIAIALGTVFLLNGAALYLFPWLGELFGLEATEFGTWAGVAIHDLSSVVGASDHFGLDALHVATAVKLSRTLWIVPLVLAVGFWLRHRSGGSDGAAGAVRAPLFILFFLLASASRSWLPGVAEWAPWLTDGGRHALSSALFVIGTGIAPAALRRVGWRPLVQGLILWVMISGLSLAWVLASR